MAHFAELDENNIVLRVLVVNNEDILIEDIESEEKGKKFLSETLSLGGKWIQTSRSGSFRKRFGHVGYFYDEEKNAFIAPKPFNSWTFNYETLDWQAPKPQPNEGYVWNEEIHDWYCGTCE
jgi:hypothetical protein